MVERENLPEQQEFVTYLRSQTTAKELAEKTGIKKTTVEHWFRKDKAGFNHPTIEDWEMIKPHLKEVKYDKELTTLTSIEWKSQELWPTPRSSVGMSMSMETVNKAMENNRGYKHNLEEKVAMKHTSKKSSGSLNPQWVEWLMGYPIGWTDLNH